MILDVYPWVDVLPFDLNNNWFPNSGMHFAIAVQLSSQSDEKDDDFRNLTSRWPLTSKSIGFSVKTTSTIW